MLIPLIVAVTARRAAERTFIQALAMQMIVASRLTDGRVVFLAEGVEWVESIEAGLVADSDEAAEKLLEQAQVCVRDSLIVEPYAIDITIDAAGRRPTALREAIRAFGPTIADPTSVQRR
jgi:hypothetical protein